MIYGASAYRNTEAITSDPYKLILMLYDACIKNLCLVNMGIDEKNIVKRSEHLYKVIEIINELLISVNGETEQAAFLRGLYLSILVELPKVNLTNDKSVIDKAIKYIAELRRIWQEQIINKNNLEKNDLNNDINKIDPTHNQTIGTQKTLNYNSSAQPYQKACFL